MWSESDSVALLRLFATKRIGPRAIGNALDLAASRGRPLHELASTNESEFLQQVSRERSPTDLALADESQAHRLHQELKTADVMILVRGTPEYPDRLARALGDSAPPVLFVWGDQRLLNMPSAAFCGARAASNRGTEIAATCARMLAENGINVVSGYAKGVDSAAHEAALRAGGSTTIVLAEGIFGFRKKNHLRELINNANSVVVSQYPPRLPWAIHNAMQRNSTICGLADSMVLIETRESGGTFEAGKAALSRRVATATSWRGALWH